MAREWIENEKFEGVRFLDRNFSGREVRDKSGKVVNQDGHRNFTMIIADEDRAREMQRIGWNVKEIPPNEEYPDPLYFLKVTVRFHGGDRKRGPKIITHTNRSRAILDEESVDSLDWADIAGCDLVITPYNWSINGSEGVSAYLKTMHVLLEEDEFGDKWAEEESPEDDY